MERNVDSFIDQNRQLEENNPNEPKKKKRGRPPGLTKAKIEERKKQREIEAIKRGALNLPPQKKRGRGRPPKEPKITPLQKALVDSKLERKSDSDSDVDSDSDSVRVQNYLLSQVYRYFRYTKNN